MARMCVRVLVDEPNASFPTVYTFCAPVDRPCFVLYGIFTTSYLRSYGTPVQPAVWKKDSTETVAGRP
jgi:hypothetical protein